MKIVVLGVCGTFMASVACLAQAMGHEVTGYDSNAYPPMSDVLTDAGITIHPMPEEPALPEQCDCVLVGNCIRGDGPWPAYLESSGVAFQSAAQWLYEKFLNDKQVISVSGTHGKTTTTSMIVSILQAIGWDPGYLIGGFPVGLGAPAYAGTSPYFVIEADEYSTAYFDHGPKFMHFHPSYWVINNMEFDHADLYADLAAIQQVFTQGIAQLKTGASLIVGEDSPALMQVVEDALIPDHIGFGTQSQWSVGSISDSGQAFDVQHKGEVVARVDWSLSGNHNRLNALAAISVVAELGVPPEDAANALSGFKGVKRRMELLGEVAGTVWYDDFAHHPTAMKETLDGLRKKLGPDSRIVAIVHFASNTMRAGHHDAGCVASSLQAADDVVLLADSEECQLASIEAALSSAKACYSVPEVVPYLTARLTKGDHVVFMGNRNFSALREALKLGLLET